MTPEDEEMLEEEGPESPPLDLTDAAVIGPAPQRQEARLRH